MIRPATIADVPAIRGLFAQLLAEVRTRYPEAGAYPAIDNDALDQFTLCLVDIVKMPALWMVTVDDDEGVVVGFVVAEHCRHPIGQPAEFAQVHWLYVLPSHRGQAITRRFGLDLVRWCEARGIGHIECEGSPGDSQHEQRGWHRFRERYHLSVNELVAHLASSMAVEPAIHLPVIEPKSAPQVRRHVNHTPLRRRRRKREPARDEA